MVTCLLPQKNLDEIDVKRSNSVIRVDINLELQDSMLNSASNHYIEGIRSEKNIQMLSLLETLNICKHLLNNAYVQKYLKLGPLS